MEKKRYEWVDTVKALGIFLVFYGHYVEAIYLDLGSNIAHEQYRFIYSFHMPLFFILSGFFFSEKSKSKTILSLFYLRIIPVITFGLISIPIWLVYNRLIYGDFQVMLVLSKMLNYLGGEPSLNATSWFLICLFTMECLILLLRFDSNKKILNSLLGVFLIVSGYYLTKYSLELTPHLKLVRNFWYFHESFIAIGFYLIGNGIFSFLNNKYFTKSIIPLIFMILLLIVYVSIFHLFPLREVVVMANSEHGNISSFLAYSLIGSLFIISLGRILPVNKVSSFLGSNTLILLGLNGFFFHFFNRHIVKFSMRYLDESYLSVYTNAIIVTIISLCVCYPLIMITNRYIPQLVGKPFLSGPILKPLNKYFS